MDPDALIEMLAGVIEDKDFEAADVFREALATWIDGGGRLPDTWTTAFRDVFRYLLAEPSTSYLCPDHAIPNSRELICIVCSEPANFAT